MLVSVRRSHQAVKHSFDIYTKELCGTDFFTKGLCDKSVDRQVGSQKLFVLRKAGWPSNNLIGAAPAAASALFDFIFSRSHSNVPESNCGAFSNVLDVRMCCLMLCPP